MTRFTAEPDAARSCQGKVRHANVAAAKFALRESIKTFGNPALVYYYCQHCYGYHIGRPKSFVSKRLRYDGILKAIDRANGRGGTR